MKNVLNAFSNFLSEKPSTTLIHFTVNTNKTKTLRKILASLAQSDANLSYKVNATICQMANEVHAQEFFNAMHDLLNVTTYVVAMDTFANNLTLTFLKSY
ncbi:8015_t:CDS:2 [Cetraspora pellucida]|uniref:8015_t:CDS:1 n=1 Tax=Cetraspora pellucida TaxID=1433469 RepID=A0ACA9KIB1_9GLOM|nr:8015_t:CDS:2 [Cetraspora pellucida]